MDVVGLLSFLSKLLLFLLLFYKLMFDIGVCIVDVFLLLFVLDVSVVLVELFSVFLKVLKLNGLVCVGGSGVGEWVWDCGCDMGFEFVDNRLLLLLYWF